MKKHRRIYVALRLQYYSNRAFLSGVAQFIRRNPNLRATVAEKFHDFDDDALAQIIAEGYDGIITVMPHSTAAQKLLTKAPIPIVFLGTGKGDMSERELNTVFIRSDDCEIGKCAARYLLSLGKFATYIFLDLQKRRLWAKERCRGFSEELKRHGLSAVHISSEHEDGSLDDLHFITQSLLDLPRPIAVFAAYDNRALHALSACSHPKLQSPKNVSVIGVDNDEVLCEFSSPALTSIATGTVQKGVRAAEELESILRRRTKPIVKTVILPVQQVVERESTRPTLPAVRLVENARRYIADNAAQGISVNDVASAVGVSRALLDRRFKELTNSTVLAEINAMRLKKLAQLLTKTSLPIYKLSAQCGFKESNYAKRAFKKAFGTSMREFRSSH